MKALKAFTLIELLVVMAILIPVLGAARKQAAMAYYPANYRNLLAEDPSSHSDITLASPKQATQVGQSWSGSAVSRARNRGPERARHSYPATSSKPPRWLSTTLQAESPTSSEIGGFLV